MSDGRLRPLRAIPSSESDTGISDPRHNVAPVPDYTRVRRGGIDNSPACIGAVLAAINHAHARRAHPAHGAAERIRVR